jgi:hypothetical protein
MKQIWPDYSYSPATNVLTLTGLNIDRDQLLLVTAADRGRIMYNFADSAVTASAYTAGANTALTLVASTAGLTTTASLVIYYDDQLQSTAISISNFPATQTIAGTVTANGGNFVYAQDEATTSEGDRGVLIGWSDNDTGEFRNVRDTQPLPVTASNLADVLDQYEVNTEDKLFAVVASLNGQGYVSDSAKSHITNSVTIGSLPAISGTVTIGNSININQIGEGVPTQDLIYDDGTVQLQTRISSSVTLPISGTVTIGNSVTIASFATSVTARLINPAGTAVTYAEVGTAGSPSIDVLSVQGVTSGTAIPISISSVTIGSLPAISGTVTANTFALQGTAVTTSNFTSTTASTVLANYNATREVLTIFNEGAGLLFVCPGATCTTVQYQVRLSSGDYYEVPNHQTTITHSAVFATAGTARVTEVS